MIYTDFKGKRLSLLGFGAMRLPTLPSGEIDEALSRRMIELALAEGVNYFDTAYPYHGGKSELTLGEILADHPRDTFYLATKYPGHQIASSYDPKEVFEHQLKKCGVEYFDFYLLHNVCEKSLPVYLDPKYGIIDYFKEQKRLGRIKHLGFSTHARLDCLKEFLDLHGEDMEFCQIQLNYLDWSLQDARRKVELLSERNIPIWVMEPVRGGKLCKLSEEDTARLSARRPNDSVASWGFRYLEDIPGVTMILSGMSTLEQVEDNLKTFASPDPISADERDMLHEIARGMLELVPCTACRYCTEGCPMKLDIPALIAMYNEFSFANSTNTAMRLEGLEGVIGGGHPDTCISCGKCTRICPQGINIPEIMHKLTEKLKTIPKWGDICRVREEEAKRMKK